MEKIKKKAGRPKGSLGKKKVNIENLIIGKQERGKLSGIVPESIKKNNSEADEAAASLDDFESKYTVESLIVNEDKDINKLKDETGIINTDNKIDSNDITTDILIKDVETTEKEKVLTVEDTVKESEIDYNSFREEEQIKTKKIEEIQAEGGNSNTDNLFWLYNIIAPPAFKKFKKIGASDKKRAIINKIDTEELEITDKQKIKMIKGGAIVETAEKYMPKIDPAIRAVAELIGYTGSNYKKAFERLNDE